MQRIKDKRKYFTGYNITIFWIELCGLLQPMIMEHINNRILILKARKHINKTKFWCSSQEVSTKETVSI